jgi:hypothetical protein
MLLVLVVAACMSLPVGRRAAPIAVAALILLIAFTVLPTVALAANEAALAPVVDSQGNVIDIPLNSSPREASACSTRGGCASGACHASGGSFMERGPVRRVLRAPLRAAWRPNLVRRGVRALFAGRACGGC